MQTLANKISSKEHLRCRIISTSERYIRNLRQNDMFNIEEIDGLKIAGLLSSGGQANIYLASDPVGQKHVIKVIHPDKSKNPIYQKAFFREYCITSSGWENLSHSSRIGRLLSGQLYLVQTFLAGIPLSSVIDPLSTKLALSIGASIADTLSVAHSNQIVHRDISMGNIMLVPNSSSSTYSVYVIDWGIAASIENTHNELCEPNLRIAPPEWLKNKTFDYRSDIYSLGMVLYGLISGTYAYAFKNRFPEYSEMVDAHLNHSPQPLDTPQHISRLILKALEKSPDARYQTMEEFRSALLTAQHC